MERTFEFLLDIIEEQKVKIAALEMTILTLKSESATEPPKPKKRSKTSCPHGKSTIYTCVVCKPLTALKNIITVRARKATGGTVNASSIEKYLGCSMEHYKKHLEDLFDNDMNWENYGTAWNIDHILPLKEEGIDIEETIQRLHFNNTAPELVKVNLSKSNKIIEDEFI